MFSSAADMHEVAQPDAGSPLLGRRKADLDDEMDITPMIDITFLLLIYFLLVSVPDMQASIQLPRARHGDPVSQRIATIITLGESTGGPSPVYLADAKTPTALVDGNESQQQLALVEHVRTGFQKEDKIDVVIKADRRVPHRDVARVMRAVSQVEGVRLHLAVLEPNRE